MFANKGFTCGRGIRVTGEGVAEQIYLYEFEVCLSPDISGLSVLLPITHLQNVVQAFVARSTWACAKPQGQRRGRKLGAGAARGAHAGLLGLFILSEVLCCPCAVHDEELHELD